MKFIAKTLYGLEKVLAKELEELGASEIKTANRAVLFQGNLQLLYEANYMLRTALSILWQISEFRISSADDLYNRAGRIEWERLMDVSDTFSIVPVVQSPRVADDLPARSQRRAPIGKYRRRGRGA